VDENHCSGSEDEDDDLCSEEEESRCDPYFSPVKLSRYGWRQIKKGPDIKCTCYLCSDESCVFNYFRTFFLNLLCNSFVKGRIGNMTSLVPVFSRFLVKFFSFLL
jgi:hypothetical protein